jgi:hypothetical protein
VAGLVHDVDVVVVFGPVITNENHLHLLHLGRDMAQGNPAAT